MSALMLVFCVQLLPAWAAETVEFEVAGEYGQTEARGMLKMVNDFRTGRYIDGGRTSVWALASDGSDDTASYSGLSELKYDYELEKVAMQRAMETVLQNGHTRPKYANNSNSKSCFELYPSGYSAMGENIASGYGGLTATASDAFAGWCETDCSYAGQGHRRNMLGRGFNRVGIAHVVIHWSGNLTEGTRDHAFDTDIHYWVQEFGYRTDTFGLSETDACDTESVRNVEVLKDSVERVALLPKRNNVSVVYGDTLSMDSEATTALRLEGTWPLKFALSWSDGAVSTGSCVIPVKGDFSVSSENDAIASVSGKSLTATGVGTTQLHLVSSLDSAATADVSLTVKQAPIGAASVSFQQAGYTYTGKRQEPAPEVRLGGKLLAAGTDYTVKYADNTEAGTATVSISGQGNYTGTATGTFEIVKKNLGDGDVSAAPVSSVVYNGRAQTPGLTVTFNGMELRPGTDYTVECANNVNAGTATATVTGKGNYTGTLEVPFDIAKAPLVATFVDETIDLADEPALKVAYNGFAAGDSESVLSQKPTVEKPAELHIGTYELTPAGGAADNYELAYKSGTLAVVDKAADVLEQAETLLSTTLTADSAEPLAALQEQLAALTPAQQQRLETLQARSSLAGVDLESQLASAVAEVAELVEADARADATVAANKAISAAQGANKGILAASKATKVPYNKKWATAADVAKLAAALADLRSALDDGSATTEDVVAKTAALENATAVFEKAVKKGTMNTGTIKTASKNLKWSKLKKKAQTFKLATTGVAEKAKVTWKKVKGSSKIKVNAKTGKITVAKKGIKKGKAVKVTVSMTMAKTKNCTKTVVKKTVTIKVK